jgi:Xaa-Pro aminopeptidase
LILIDAGQSTQLPSDMTVPSRSQVHRSANAVYALKRSKQNVTGTIWKQYHIEVGKLMTSELLGLGLYRQSRCAK